MKTAIVFQGGGPLGAFGCGAWQVIAPWLREQGHELVAVAGASIGALNAAAVACHAGDDDLGAAALQTLWCDQIAVPLPPMPPLGPLGDEMRAWSGWWSGLALGNPALFAPLYQHWHPLAGLQRLKRPLYSQRRMQALFARLVGAGYAGGRPAPLLAVAATDVLSGGLRLFHSDEAPVDPRHLSASAAIPLMFEPVEVDGRLYCDGEVNSRSPAGLLVAALRQGGRLRPRQGLQVLTIGQFSRHIHRLPRTTHELLDRSMQLLLADKLQDEALPVERHLDIARPPEPHEGISGQLDYSSARIARLMQMGRDAACQQLEQGVPQPA